MLEKIRNYNFCKNTEVKVNGEWSNITEVWFREELIGVVNTGAMTPYNEIQDIRN